MRSTGIPRLDSILGGGLPAGGDILLVSGGAGTGKTTLCLQAAFHVASQGDHAAFVTTFSESPEKLVGHVEGFSFYEKDLVGHRLHLRNLYPMVSGDLRDLGNALIETVEEHDAKLLVFDGLSSVRDLQGDDLAVRKFIYDLGSGLAGLDTAILLTSSYMGSDREHLPELTMVDGIMHLESETRGNRTIRSLQVQKMRGRGHLLGRHSLRFDEDGISTFPRTESLVRPGDSGLADERKSMGLDVLDELMNGGPPERSLTMVAGAPTTGKTAVGLRFIHDGCAKGEKSVVVSFRENARQLIDKAARFGIDIADAVEDGRVRVIHHPPIDLDVDAVALEIRDAVRATGAQRVLLDTIDDLDAGILDERRHRGFMAALAQILRQMEVTSVAILQVPQVAGPELDVGKSAISAFAENLILLRNVEYQGRLLRILSVVKMRDSAYDSTVRQYRVTDQGLTVLGPDETEPGLLAGISSLPSEARVKRESPESQA